jgi:predicted acylesterase/phospholipase RssA
VLQERLRRLLGDMTFAEAYQRSGEWVGGRAPAPAAVERRPAAAHDGPSDLNASQDNPHGIKTRPQGTQILISNQSINSLPPAGRIVNIAVTAADTSEPPRLLNYLTAPHVLVWSAVACSSAFPLLFAPQQLLARDAKGGVVGCARRPKGGWGEGGVPLLGGGQRRRLAGAAMPPRTAWPLAPAPS